MNYIVLANKVDNTYECGILDSNDNEPLVHEDGTLWRIKITDEEAQKYLDAFKDNKQVIYNIDTQEITLEDVPPPPPHTLQQQAQTSFNEAIPYGDGYKWRKLTSDQQDILTAYLDSLQAIIDGIGSESEVLPIKPDFIK